MEAFPVTGPNLYRNNIKAVAVGGSFWDETEQSGLACIVADFGADKNLVTSAGHAFVNLSCCSYLDLDTDPRVVEGAIEALRKYGALDHCISRVRVQLPALLELEEELSALFGATVVTAISASAASASVLPLLASGHFTGGVKPALVFDKNCHFSMNLMKPVCADESLVLTCEHDDLDFLEAACRRYAQVAYVADGTYSLGGVAPVRELLELQDRYGLFLYFDDSHSLSIRGRHGEGHVRSAMDSLGPNTIIVATLNKAFGTSGAAIMFGPSAGATLKVLERFGGPMAWSQPMNIPAIGASLASAAIHRTAELPARQRRLEANIALFDSLVASTHTGDPFPIKVVPLSNERVVACGKRLYDAGFYVSPVFFPIVPRNEAGLRVMLRQRLSEAEIRRLSGVLQSLSSGAPVPAGVSERRAGRAAARRS